MAFLAGVDEAGYGPFVGPMTIGFALFRVPDGAADLGKILAPVAAPKAGRKRSDRRIWLDDSKLVHQGTLGRGRLERSVAAFRELSAEGRSALEGWVGEPPSGPPRWLRASPWHRKLEGPLCPGADPGRARLDAAALARALEKGGCALQGFGARAAPANEWNALLTQFGDNKGSAHFALTMEVVRHLLAASGDAPLRIELDRHGGRSRYGELLRAALEADALETHGENEAGSAYTLHFGARAVQLRFSEDADAKFAPVALASLAAKQTREVMMDLHNAWFGERLPDLAPTKGYGTDGRRWLREVEPRLAELKLGIEHVRRER